MQARSPRYDRRKPPPPDLPSLLFDQRIVYLGMPVSTAGHAGAACVDLGRCACACAVGQFWRPGNP